MVNDDNSRIHIGLKRDNSQNPYLTGEFTKWTDGKPLDEYKPWWKDEPNDWNGIEDCTHMGFGDLLSWNDIPCDSLKEKFVCKNVLTENVNASDAPKTATGSIAVLPDRDSEAEKMANN